MARTLPTVALSALVGFVIGVAYWGVARRGGRARVWASVALVGALVLGMVYLAYGPASHTATSSGRSQ